MDINFFSNIKNPIYTKDKNILLTVDINGFGQNIPFVACPDDIESHGKVLYQQAIEKKFGEIQPYVEKEIVPFQITRRQGRLVLLKHGMLDALESYINSLTGDEQRIAQIEYDANFWERNSQFVNSFAKGIFNLTDEQIDNLFIEANSL
jgi:hypothetical protein